MQCEVCADCDFLSFLLYLIVPNHGAIYQFHSQTSKKKPTLKVIVGVYFCMVRLDFLAFYSNLPYNYRTKKNRKTFFLEGDAVLNLLKVGIEPTRPKSLDFESSASTNSATRANVRELGSPKIGRQK